MIDDESVKHIFVKDLLCAGPIPMLWRYSSDLDRNVIASWNSHAGGLEGQ